MNPHDSIKSNRPGKHAAAKRDGLNENAGHHLPGPWNASRLGQSRLYQLSPVSRGVLGPVALELHRASLSESCADATVRMIQAAPEMLEALTYCEAWFAEHSPTAKTVLVANGAEVHFPHPMLVSIRAAIAKATGGGQ